MNPCSKPNSATKQFSRSHMHPFNSTIFYKNDSCTIRFQFQTKEDLPEILGLATNFIAIDISDASWKKDVSHRTSLPTQAALMLTLTANHADACR